MTKLRKAWLAVAVAAVITTMTGLAPAASAAPQESKKIARIGLMVQDMSNPFFSAMERNAKQAAAKIGATLNVQDAQVDLANQNTPSMSPGSNRRYSGQKPPALSLSQSIPPLKALTRRS